jgi:hypothetical protein
MKIEGLDFDTPIDEHVRAHTNLIRMCILTYRACYGLPPTQARLADVAQSILDIIDPMVEGAPAGDTNPHLRDDVWVATFNMASQGD